MSFAENCKTHDLILEGIDTVLKKRGIHRSQSRHSTVGVVALSCCSTEALVEPAGRHPCCSRSPPVAGRRPLDTAMTATAKLSAAPVEIPTQEKLRCVHCLIFF
jgi:hypothetical protein